MKMKKQPRFPLVCFDLDGTLIQNTVFIWTTLHEYFQTDREVRARASDDYFSGRISYEEWFYTDIELLSRAGADRESMTRVIDSLEPARGAFETIAELKNAGVSIAVISGSIDLALNRHFDEDVFDHILINRFYFDERGALVGGQPTEYDLESKADGLLELARREGIGVSETAYVGDNFNDAEVARTAGLSIAFKCKSDKLREVADVCIEGDDLRLILEHLV